MPSRGACSRCSGWIVDTRTPAHRLGVAQQQLVEIAKALSQDARLLVMDEPTAALLRARDRAAVRGDPARSSVTASRSSTSPIGCSEVFALGDRVTVLRDGRKVAVAAPGRNLGGRAGAHDGRARGGHRRTVTASARSPASRCSSCAMCTPTTVCTAVNLDCARGRDRGPGRPGRRRAQRARARAIFGADRVAARRGSRSRPVSTAERGARGRCARSAAASVWCPRLARPRGLRSSARCRTTCWSAALAALFPRRWYRPHRRGACGGRR